MPPAIGSGARTMCSSAADNRRKCCPRPRRRRCQDPGSDPARRRPVGRRDRRSRRIVVQPVLAAHQAAGGRGRHPAPRDHPRPRASWAWASRSIARSSSACRPRTTSTPSRPRSPSWPRWSSAPPSPARPTTSCASSPATCTPSTTSCARRSCRLGLVSNIESRDRHPLGEEHHRRAPGAGQPLRERAAGDALRRTVRPGARSLP